MNVPEELPYITATNDATEIPSQYPATIDVQRWDGNEMVSMVVLQRTDAENGIYQGTYEGSYLKNNEYYGFEFIADGTWYRADASDNTKLAVSDDSLSKFYFDRADDNVTSINVTITVNLKELSWEYTINSQETGIIEEPKSQITMSYWNNATSSNETICTLDETDDNVYEGEYEGANVSFQFIRDNSWYGAKDNDTPNELSLNSGINTWFYNYTDDWPENVHVKITVDFNTMTWSYEEITE